MSAGLSSGWLGPWKISAGFPLELTPDFLFGMGAGFAKQKVAAFATHSQSFMFWGLQQKNVGGFGKATLGKKESGRV